jgi:hypothetical protein
MIGYSRPHREGKGLTALMSYAAQPRTWNALRTDEVTRRWP